MKFGDMWQEADRVVCLQDKALAPLSVLVSPSREALLMCWVRLKQSLAGCNSIPAQQSRKTIRHYLFNAIRQMKEGIQP